MKKNTETGVGAKMLSHVANRRRGETTKNKWIRKEERKLIKNPVSERNMKIW